MGARIRAWRPDEIVIRVLPEPGVAEGRVPVHAPTTRRLVWSSERGLSGQLPPSIRSLAIDCTDRSGLMALGRDRAMVARTRAITVRLASWRAPMPGWTGRLGSLRGVMTFEVHVPRAGQGQVRLRITLSAERPIREFIAAIDPLLMPGAPLDAPVGASLGANGQLPAWLPAGADESAHFAGSPLVPMPEHADVISGKPRKPDDPPPNRPAVDAELVMGVAKPQGFGVAPTRALRVTDELIEEDPTGRVLVDVLGWAGRPWNAPAGDAGSARIEIRSTSEGPRWRVVAAGTVATPWFGFTAPVSDVPGFEGPAWWSLTLDVGSGVVATRAAALVVRLALSGVVLDGRGLATDLTSHLSDELAGVLAEPLPPDGDTLLWEIRSVRQRRAAVRGHATSLLLDDRLRPGAMAAAAPPTVTALLVTRRPSLAVSALRMLRDQTYPRLTIILALHGVGMDAELADEVAQGGPPVEVLAIPAESVLGEALAIATARAQGSFVAKIDDDDVYGPEHIWDLIIGRALSGATVVGKSSSFVMLDRAGITVRRDVVEHDTYGRVVAGGTIMIARGDLEALGGWRPTPSGVDRALLDRVLQAGGLIYRTWSIGFIYRRHGVGHTWDPSDEYFLRGAGARWEGVPDLPEFGTRHVRRMDEVDPPH